MEKENHRYIAWDGMIKEPMTLYSVAWIVMILSMVNNAKKISKNIEKASQILRNKEQTNKQ